MKQSTLVFKTRKEAPKDEVSKNAELLIRAGFVHKEMAGVYVYLPLGLRVLKKIENIIREEMNSLGGQEIELTALQDRSVWEKTGRWDDAVVDNWFKTKLKNNTELGLAFTHEEPLTNIMRDHIRSFRDLPTYVYQFQTKFRNEARAKSGVMRGREFLMKDLYSFSKDEKEHQIFYEKAKQAYLNIFEKVGLGDCTYTTFALGGSFSKYSHEFQTLSKAGEDTIYVNKEKKIAVNEEALNDEVLVEIGLKKEDFIKEKGIEVGNIFTLGLRFSEPFELNYKNEAGETKPVFMGSYGIGLGRVMGTIVEVLSDDKGLVWPKSVAPYDIHILALPDQSGEVAKLAEKLYKEIGVSKEVLFDDRDIGAGVKFADADLIGIPTRIVIGSKNLVDGKVEVTDRKTGETKLVAVGDVLKNI